MHEVHGAAVYLDPQAGSPLSPTASWPKNLQLSNRFEETVQRVLSEGKCIASLEADTQRTSADGNRSSFLGCPFNIETKGQGIAGMGIKNRQIVRQEYFFQITHIGQKGIQNPYPEGYRLKAQNSPPLGLGNKRNHAGCCR